MEKLLKIIKGYVISGFLFLVFMLILAIAMRSTNLSMAHSEMYSMILLTVSALIFGLSIGITFQKRGLLTGIGFGILYVGIFVFLVTMLFHMSFAAGILNAAYLLPVLFSGIGGMIGTNLKN